MSEKDVERIARVLCHDAGIDPDLEVITFDGAPANYKGGHYIYAEGRTPRSAWCLFLIAAWRVFYELEERPIGWEAPPASEEPEEAPDEELDSSWAERHGLYKDGV